MHNIFLKKYFFIDKFEPEIIKFQDKNTFIIFRNYKKNNNLDEIIKIKKYYKKKRFKFFLADNIELAIKLDLDGAYIPSFNKNLKHLSFSLKKKFCLIGSAHNNYEYKIKKLQKVKTIFLSSIFKQNKNYLGINRFKNLSNNLKINIVALGGINNKNINKLRLLKIIGFAGISYFKKKAPKKGPLNI